MVSLYEFMEVDENASKEQIEKAYKGFLLKYRVDPTQSDEENRDNEMIINKIKMAYDILSNDEKRAAYDKSLANKRTEELLKTVEAPQKKEEPKEEPKNETAEEKAAPVQTPPQAPAQPATSAKPSAQPAQTVAATKTVSKTYEIEDDSYDDQRAAELTKEEQARIKKAAQEEFKINLQKAQKAEEEYNEAYNKAYNDYLRKMGYQVKEPWTWKRIKNLIITVVVIIVVCFIAWHIPIVRNSLTELYESNQIVKGVLDVFLAIFRAIFSIFK